MNKNNKAACLALTAFLLVVSQAIYAADEPVLQPQVDDSTASSSHGKDIPTEQALPEIDIKATRDDQGYLAPNGSTGTKTDTPLIETPASVQVVTQQLLQDQKPARLDDALANVSGVRASNIGWAENIYIRGFNTSTYFRDGFRIDDPTGLGGLLTLSNVDSIEVLKGPGSILYGRVEPGGVVNVITKQPQETPYLEVEQDVGSWNHYVTKFDATGPITDGKTLLYRVNLSYDTSDFWIDNVSDKRVFVAPTFQYKPSARTQVTLEASYSHDESTLYQQSVVPYDTTTHEFQWGDRSANPAPYYFNPDTTFAGLNWSHQIDDNWTIRQMISHNEVNFSTPLNLSTAFGPLALVGNTWILSLGSAQLSGKTVSDGTILDLTGHFQTGSAKHTLLIGADYYQMKAIYDSRYSNPGGPFVDVPLFSSTVPSPASIPLDADTFYYTDATTKSLGVYVQDQVKLPHDIDILGGLRYQDVKSNGTSTTGINFGGTGVPVANAPEHDTALTPRVGLLWQARESLSVYTSYTENFGASNASLGADWQGKSLKPEGANQYEVGAKANLLGGKAGLTAALFDLTKTNVVANDLAHPNGQGGFYPTTVGEVESKGIELTFQGELTPGWDALIAYTHDRAEVKAGTQTYPQGSAMPYVPEDMLRLFTTYKLRGEHLSGWKIGGGMTWQGAAPGLYLNPSTFETDTTTISSPAYAVFDAMASYDFNVWHRDASAQINISNIFDKDYYTDAFMYVEPWGYVTYGTPRSVLASLKIEI